MKKLIHVDMDANKSVPHDFIGKFGGASVLLKRAPKEGTGIIAGGPARNVLEIAGIKISVQSHLLQQQAERRSCYAGSTEADGVSGGSCKTSRKICRRDSGLGGLNMAEKLKVTLVKSPISAIPKHRARLRLLA